MVKNAEVRLISQNGIPAVRWERLDRAGVLNPGVINQNIRCAQSCCRAFNQSLCSGGIGQIGLYIDDLNTAVRRHGCGHRVADRQRLNAVQHDIGA